MCVVLLPLSIYFFSKFHFAAKGYLKKLEEDPTAVICLGDGAYNGCKLQKDLGIATPVPLPKSGAQPSVRICSFFLSKLMFWWS